MTRRDDFDLIESAAWEAFEEGFRCGRNVTSAPKRERFARWWHGEDRARVELPQPAYDPWSEIMELLLDAEEVIFRYGGDRKPATWTPPAES